MHDYLGMRLYFSKNGKVKGMMPKHVQSMLEKFPMGMGGLVEIPAANHLFQVKEDSSEISSHHEEVFWTLAAKIIFVSCWS